ncbi:AAA ATPase [Monascus purpureus]|uniref:Cell division control protein n=1 Tax=Monascus purpureus TaxID=5098 RepID=A0A507R1A6_MONPU|nr:AAA ATPase [Monascus purpureus]BDD55876.1 hypothetical protein MAP00_001358 [Monascus purpureus]
MAVSVLGKRQRGAIELQELPVRTSSSKRQARSVKIRQDDQDASLSSPRQLRSRTRNGTSAQQENDAEVKSPVSSIRSKHSICDDEHAVPSKKINSLFRSSKPVNDENSTPVGIKTPRKSRYHDVLDTPPVTPKHRVQISGKPLTPRTPRQATAPTTSSQTVYTQARQLFARGANPGRLIGRESEREKLVSFIQDGVESRRGGCLYVSGPPGTGKSAMVEEVCRELELKTVHISHINCASIRNARDVYSKLIEDLSEDFQVFKKSERDQLKEMFIPAKKGSGFFLVTLDEIDHLLGADSEILQSLFEWSLHKNSHLLLIGIANALDLTDRSLPQLKAKNLKPRLLPFLPYNATQIASVITNRLKSLLPADHDADANFVPFLQPAAIQLCSKKVASQTGDLRKAFELVKRAIDVIEQEIQRKLERADATQEGDSGALVENINLSSSARTPTSKHVSMASYTVFTAPRASIAHVARITSSAFGQGTLQRLQNLNLQQKAAICALIALDRKRRDVEMPSTPSKMRNQPPTVKQVFDAYCTLCRNDNILHPLTATEFKDVLSNLETMGLVGEFQGRSRGSTLVGGSRTPSKSSGPSTPVKGLDEKRLVCFVSQKEVESQISGPGENILRRLLVGEGL